MLAEAFTTLSPRLVGRYRDLLTRELRDSPELGHLHRLYDEYALRDRNLPRPVLAYFGYHAFTDAVDFTDVHRIGDGLLLPQLLRDLLAIHDDVVDEDLEKFGAPPLPVAMSRDVGTDPVLTQEGKNVALYYGDLLAGVLLRVASSLQPATTAAAVTRLIGDALYVTQRGQLAELIAEERPVTETSVDDVLLIGERKAAYYCYVFPFALGAILGGHDTGRLAPVCDVLRHVGTASQVIDDLTGAFPGVIDDHKDTLSEIGNLRRTIPLALLSEQADEGTRRLLTTAPPLAEEDALSLRHVLWNSDVPRQAVALCTRLTDEIVSRLAGLVIGRAAGQYLRDLVEHRLIASVQRLRDAL